MYDNVQMIAHHSPSVNAAGKNVTERQNAGFDPGSSVLEAFAEVFVQAAQPGPAHAAVDAVKHSGLGWIDELAAGLGHRRSVGAGALIRNQIARSFRSDLSEGCPNVLNASGHPSFAIKNWALAKNWHPLAPTFATAMANSNIAQPRAAKIDSPGTGTSGLITRRSRSFAGLISNIEAPSESRAKQGLK